MGSKSLTILLPFPPSVNNLYSPHSRHGFIKKPSYINWEWEAKIMVRKQNIVKFDKRVDIVVFLGGGTDAADCDNYSKAVCDQLVNWNIIKDDSKPYVRSTKQVWCEETKGAMVLIDEVAE